MHIFRIFPKNPQKRGRRRGNQCMSPAGAVKANWLTILDASGARIAENTAEQFAVNRIHSDRNRGDTMYHLPSSSDFFRLANSLHWRSDPCPPVLHWVSCRVLQSRSKSGRTLICAGPIYLTRLKSDSETRPTSRVGVVNDPTEDVSSIKTF